MATTQPHHDRERSAGGVRSRRVTARLMSTARSWIPTAAQRWAWSTLTAPIALLDPERIDGPAARLPLRGVGRIGTD